MVNKMKTELEKDIKKLMKKGVKTNKRLEQHKEKIGKHYKETEYSTPKEASKGSMLQKRAVEEYQINKIR
jgi:hypothetical protein